MAKIKNSGDSRCWWGCRKRETLLHCLWDCKLVQPLWKSVWQYLRKVDIVPRYTTPGYVSRRCCNKDTCSTMFIAALFIITRSWKEHRCPSIEEWIQKMWYIYTMEFYKTPMEGVTETKFGAETKGWAIQRLPHPGIHPIISHQIQTLLHMPARFYWQDPDIAIFCETMPVSGKYRSGCSQSAIGWITGPPMEELEKVPKELKGSATL